MVTKKKNFKSDKERLFLKIFIGILALVLLVLLGFSNYKLKGRRKQLNSQVSDLKQQIQELEEKKKQLEPMVTEDSNGEYLEEIARDQLNLRKPGEKVVIVKKEEAEQEEPELQPEKGWWQKIIERIKFWD